MVLNATEAGEPSLIGMPEPNSEHPSPLKALVEAYITGCKAVFQRPNTGLYSWLKERIITRNVRGLLLWHHVGCDLWRAEAQSLREAFGLPLLLLDADEAPGNSGRNAGCIQAFLEGLRT